MLVATNGYTDGVFPVPAPAGHVDPQRHHRDRTVGREPDGPAHAEAKDARGQPARRHLFPALRRTGGASSSAGRSCASATAPCSGATRRICAACCRSFPNSGTRGSPITGTARQASPSTGCLTWARRAACSMRAAIAGRGSRARPGSVTGSGTAQTTPETTRRNLRAPQQMHELPTPRLPGAG